MKINPQAFSQAGYLLKGPEHSVYQFLAEKYRPAENIIKPVKLVDIVDLVQDTTHYTTHEIRSAIERLAKGSEYKKALLKITRGDVIPTTDFFGVID